MPFSELDKLKTEILSKDLEVYRTLETWGSSLFLGAIALISKQLVDWDRPPKPDTRVFLDAWVFGVPFAIGLVAFVFLRIVNSRGRRAMRARERIIGPLPYDRRPFGLLGALFALMPLALGTVASSALATSEPSRKALGPLMALVSATAIVLALLAHWWERQPR